MSFKRGAVSEKRAVFLIPVCGQLMYAMKSTQEEMDAC